MKPACSSLNFSSIFSSILFNSILVNTLLGTEEIKYAIKTLKNGKSPGIDSIHAEMLKAAIATSSKILQQLFNNIWNNEILPSDWTKGLIVKLPKREIYKYLTTGEE
jgi:hypothetical protein